MSPLWLALALTTVVAIDVAPTIEPALKVAVPADVLDLEAAVQAKFGAPTIEPALKVAVPADVLDLEAAVQAKFGGGAEQDANGIAQVPPEVANLEAAVLAKYSAANVFDLDAMYLSKHSMDKAVHGSQPALDSATSRAHAEVPPEVTKLEKAVRDKYSAGLPSDEVTLVEHGADVVPVTSAEVSELEVAVQAKFAMGVKLQTKEAGVKKMAKETPSEVAALEAAVLAKYSTGTQNVAQVDEPTPETLRAGVKLQSKQESSMSKVATETPPGVAKPEAAVLAKYSAGLPSDEAREQAEPKSESMHAVPADVPAEVAKLEAAVLAKYSSEASADDAKQNYGEESLRLHSSPAQEAPSDKSNAMYKVDPAASKSSSMGKPSTPDAEQSAAAKLAERRSEVEDVFHLSKDGGEKVPEAEKIAEKLAEERAEVENIFHVSQATDTKMLDVQPELLADASVGRSLFRFVIIVLILLSGLGLAYHKYEMILRIIAPQSKAKQEDFDVEGCSFTASTQHGAHRTNAKAKQEDCEASAQHGGNRWPSAEVLRGSVTTACRSLQRRRGDSKNDLPF